MSATAISPRSPSPGTPSPGSPSPGSPRQDPAPGLEEQAYRHLRAALMEGVFLPGQKLSLRRVAAALGTSSMPVRTALRRLATEGALDIGPSGSATVPRLSRAAFLELGVIRAELEPLAAGLAAPHLRFRDLDELDALAGTHTAARARGDADAALRADREFLFRLYRASAAPTLLGFIEALWLRRGPLFWEARWMLVGRGSVGHRHEEIVANLRNGNAAAAAATLAAEIRGATAFLAEHLPFNGDAPVASGLERLRPVTADHGRTGKAGRG